MKSRPYCPVCARFVQNLEKHRQTEAHRERLSWRQRPDKPNKQENPIRRPSRGSVVAFVLGGGVALLTAHELCRWLQHEMQQAGYRVEEYVFGPDGREVAT